MINIDSIFRYKVPDEDKLLSFGFVKNGAVYTKEIPIMENRFNLILSVGADGKVSFRTIENELGEEYFLIHVESADGKFVNEVRSACEKVLTEISAKCFNTEILKAEQTKRIIHRIREEYSVSPEYLWAETPGNAIFRRADNGKWFAVVMSVYAAKIGLHSHGDIEIMNMKASPEAVEKLLARKDCYSAFHMNKKHWFSVCLDGSITDEELSCMLAVSYNSAAHKSK